MSYTRSLPDVLVVSTSNVSHANFDSAVHRIYTQQKLSTSFLFMSNGSICQYFITYWMENIPINVILNQQLPVTWAFSLNCHLSWGTKSTFPLQNGALWDMGLVHCGIWTTGLLDCTFFHLTREFYNIFHKLLIRFDHANKVKYFG